LHVFFNIFSKNFDKIFLNNNKILCKIINLTLHPTPTVRPWECSYSAPSDRRSCWRPRERPWRWQSRRQTRWKSSRPPHSPTGRFWRIALHWTRICHRLKIIEMNLFPLDRKMKDSTRSECGETANHKVQNRQGQEDEQNQLNFHNPLYTGHVDTWIIYFLILNWKILNWKHLIIN